MLQKTSKIGRDAFTATEYPSTYVKHCEQG